MVLYRTKSGNITQNSAGYNSWRIRKQTNEEKQSISHVFFQTTGLNVFWNLLLFTSIQFISY